ncbi:hypothetical protein Tco_0465488 [Tanacetum coccineum]
MSSSSQPLPTKNNDSNTKSEQETATLAFHKKRARRVSFVENTTVHIFNRDDEDSATPVNHKQQQSPSDEPMFWNDRDNGNGEDEDMEDDENDDEMDESESVFAIAETC